MAEKNTNFRQKKTPDVALVIRGWRGQGGGVQKPSQVFHGGHKPVVEGKTTSTIHMLRAMNSKKSHLEGHQRNPGEMMKREYQKQAPPKKEWVGFKI